MTPKQMADKLRDRSYSTKGKDPLMEEAADLIEGLLLTAPELELLAGIVCRHRAGAGPETDLLRSLLERLK
jgi:hypothetical protein